MRLIIDSTPSVVISQKDFESRSAGLAEEEFDFLDSSDPTLLNWGSSIALELEPSRSVGTDRRSAILESCVACAY